MSSAKIGTRHALAGKRAFVFISQISEDLHDTLFERDPHYYAQALGKLTQREVEILVCSSDRADQGYHKWGNGISLRVSKSRWLSLVSLLLEVYAHRQESIVVAYYPTLSSLLVLTACKIMAKSWNILKSDSTYEFLEQSHPVGYTRYKAWLVRMLMVRLATRVIDVLVAETPDSLDRFRHAVPCMPRLSVVIPNGSRFSPVEAKRAREKYPQEKRILYVGRVDDPLKGVEELVRAFARISTEGWTLRLVGQCSTDWRSRVLGDLPNAARARVVVCDHIRAKDELLREYVQATVFVLPSKREGFNLSILEAAMTYNVVIASDVGGNATVLEHGKCGILIPPGSEDELGQALRAVLDAPEAYTTMAKALRDRAEGEYSWEVVECRLKEVMNRIQGCAEGGHEG